MEINKIYNEDCFLTMSNLDIVVNAVITSPPYNTGGRIEYWSNKKINGNRIYSQQKRYDKYMDCKSSEEYIDWTVKLFDLYNKILEKDGCVLYNISYGFMGTGTTANACMIEKRNYIGSELSEEQCKYAEKRLFFQQSQPKLF